MTTTVKVIVHCSEGKECVISVDDGFSPKNDLIRQNGEEAEVYVYDDRIISIRERIKE